MKTIRIAIIGTGVRSVQYTKLCVSDVRDGVTVKALTDIDAEKLKQYAETYFSADSMPALYTDYKEMLEKEDVDTVIICTPDTTHREITVDCLQKNKHILIEKPLATTLEDCIKIHESGVGCDKVFRLGFVLRYTHIYAKIKELVSGGTLGQILTVEAKEMLSHLHGGSFFRRWHRYKKNNGGFLNAKCSHDMDILNWVIGSDPVYVSAFGSRSYFNPIEGAAERCKDCNLRNTCKFFFKTEDYGEFHSVQDTCVFNVDKDIVDHEVVNIEYENQVTASFTVSMVSAEPNRTMTIFGSEATLFADFAKNHILVKFIQPQSDLEFRFKESASGHGGGDLGIYCNFIDSIRSAPREGLSDLKAGVLSSAVALAAEASMERRQIINLKKTLGF